MLMGKGNIYFVVQISLVMRKGEGAEKKKQHRKVGCVEKHIISKTVNKIMWCKWVI